MEPQIPLQTARANMFGAQRELDHYLKSNVTDLVIFQTLFHAAQRANAQYSELLKEYMLQKYSHSRDQSSLLVHELALRQHDLAKPCSPSQVITNFDTQSSKADSMLHGSTTIF
jgi:hypothetical protein